MGGGAGGLRGVDGVCEICWLGGDEQEALVPGKQGERGPRGRGPTAPPRPPPPPPEGQTTPRWLLHRARPRAARAGGPPPAPRARPPPARDGHPDRRPRREDDTQAHRDAPTSGRSRRRGDARAHRGARRPGPDSPRRRGRRGADAARGRSLSRLGPRGARTLRARPPFYLFPALTARRKLPAHAKLRRRPGRTASGLAFFVALAVAVLVPASAGSPGLAHVAPRAATGETSRRAGRRASETAAKLPSRSRGTSNTGPSSWSDRHPLDRCAVPAARTPPPGQTGAHVSLRARAHRHGLFSVGRRPHGGTDLTAAATVLGTNLESGRPGRRGLGSDSSGTART